MNQWDKKIEEAISNAEKKKKPTPENGVTSHALAVTRRFVAGLDQLTTPDAIKESREKLLNHLRDNFLASKLEANRQSEETRSLVLQQIQNRLGEMGDRTLLDSLRALNEGNPGEDMAIITGQASGKGINIFNQIDKRQAVVVGGSSPVTIDREGAVSTPHREFDMLSDSLQVVGEVINDIEEEEESPSSPSS